MATPPDLIPILQRQLSLITRRQAIEALGSESIVDKLLQHGEVQPAHRGVYRLPGSVASPQQGLLAAILRAGRGARAAGASACALYALEGFELARPWCVAVPAPRTVTGVTFDVRVVPSKPATRQIVSAVPALPPAFALLDVAAQVSPRKLRVAVDDGRRRGLLRLVGLERAVQAWSAHPGAPAIRQLLGSGDLKKDSEGERNMAAAFALAGLQPQWQVWLFPDVRVDAYFPEARLVVEYDSRDYHSLPRDVAADRARQRRLERAGYHVERVTGAMLRDDPAGTVARIAWLRARRVVALAG